MNSENSENSTSITNPKRKRKRNRNGRPALKRRMRHLSREAPSHITTESFGPSWKPCVFRTNTFLEIMDVEKEKVHRCHYFKKLFSEDEMSGLAQVLRSDGRWSQVLGDAYRVKKPQPLPDLPGEEDEEEEETISEDEEEEDEDETLFYEEGEVESLSLGEGSREEVREEERMEREEREVEERGKRREKAGKTYVAITGEWDELGHCNPLKKKHKVHPAGKAGKLEFKEGTTVLLDALKPLAAKASDCLRKYRPDVEEVIGPLTFPFDRYHLFMCSEGGSGFHRDPKDYVSFIFVIECSGKRGILELGGLGDAFKFSVGDAILLDSRALEHGTIGEIEEGRKVGLFIVHRTFLYLLGVEKDKVHNSNKI
jgi:hypothetical protein